MILHFNEIVSKYQDRLRKLSSQDRKDFLEDIDHTIDERLRVWEKKR